MTEYRRRFVFKNNDTGEVREVLSEVMTFAKKVIDEYGFEYHEAFLEENEELEKEIRLLIGKSGYHFYLEEEDVKKLNNEDREKYLNHLIKFVRYIKEWEAAKMEVALVEKIHGYDTDRSIIARINVYDHIEDAKLQAHHIIEIIDKNHDLWENDSNDYENGDL